MREEFKVLISDKVNSYALFLSVACIVLGLLFFVVKVWSLPPLLPLFYNRPWGIAQLGTPLHLLLLLLLDLAILIVNLTLALKLYKSIILLSRILLWISVLVSLLSTTVVIRVILLIS